MPAARYWRAVGLQSVGGGALELSALHLYLGGVRVDAAATLTSVIAPASGSLAALQDDDDTATTARWLDVSSPGFALVWDFGAGNTQDVGAVRLGAGATYAEWLETLTLQYSSDGVVWAVLWSIPAFSWPGANAMQSVPADSDPVFDKVALLLHMGGVDGSTTFTDSSSTPKTVTAIGNAKISTAQSKWEGGSSLLLDGALDGLSLGSSSALNFGVEDFTVEMWVYVISHTNIIAALLASGGSSWAEGNCILRFDTGNRLSFYIHTGGPVLVGASVFPVGQWQHVALCRSGGTLRIYKHGVQDASAAINNTVNFNTGLRTFIGYSDFDKQSLNGYIDELRITKGVARYTADFTPPARPFPDSAGTTVQRKLGVKQSAPPILLSGGSAGDTVMTLPPGTTHLDLQDANGAEGLPTTTRYRIPGPRWVKEKTASTNVPLRRRVQLYNQRDSRLVREVWSDPVTGEYSFDNIRGDTTYFVIAFDHTGHYRAVIADNLTPEPIP